MNREKSTAPAAGRLVTLGNDVDLADADALLSVLRVTKGLIERHRDSGARHLANEALWTIWERRRLPRPLVVSKYPKSYPWSPAAQAVYAEHGGRAPQGGWGLVLDHMIPRLVLLGPMIDASASLDARTLSQHLHARMAGAVITRSDERAFATAKLTSRVVEGADPDDFWARYRASGLEPHNFAPLESPT